MSQLATNHCMRHFEEPYVAHCRTCNRPFCGRCLVFAFGPDKPPYCIGCALTASGVRNKTIKPVAAAAATPTDRREERNRKREEKRLAKAEARAAKAAIKALAPPMADAARSSNVPAPQHMTMPTSRYSPQGADQPVA
ncbi:MAG: B-box zinc finger protein [Acidimicrobiales bacterium]